MDAAIKAYNHVYGRWNDIQKLYHLAKRLKHKACEAWCIEQLDGILDTFLGDRSSTITCLVELAAFQNNPKYGNNAAWFKAK